MVEGSCSRHKNKKVNFMQEKDFEYTGYNKNLREVSKKLRKNMTPQEKHLWYDFLSKHNIKFVKQRPIGRFVADFYCSKAKLVIEIDGSQHYTDEGKNYDEFRTEIINKYGVKVVRFSNYDIDNNFEGVCAEIEREIKDRLQ